jgi:2-methylcitrate dehydratase PrpD
LQGYVATEADFASERLAQTELMALEQRVQLENAHDLEPSAARMTITMADGQQRAADVVHSLGNPENPMTWQHLEAKFMPLVRPVTAAKTPELFGLLRDFTAPGRFAEVRALL